MSYNFQILSGTKAIGVLPSSELLKSSVDSPLDFGDIINSWVIYTKRTTTTCSPLGSLINIMPNIFNLIIPQADGFAPLDASQEGKPNVDELEVVVFKGKDYYAIEAETLDFGLVEMTLHEVNEFHELWDDQDAEELVAENSRLLAEFVLNAATNSLTVTLPSVTPAPVGIKLPVQPYTPPAPVGRAAPATRVKVDTVGTAHISTSGNVTVGGGVQFAQGFLGFNAADPASVAQGKLGALLGKRPK